MPTANHPVYQPLQNISQEIASLLDQLTVGITNLCGFYLTTEQRNKIVFDISDLLLEAAKRHGVEDSQHIN